MLGSWRSSLTTGVKIMVLEQLRTSTVNLPLVGAISIAGLLVAGGIIFFLLRRKKSVKLTF